MVRVLVTGASGFIGSKLTERLVAQGDDVTCLVRAASRLDRLRPLGVSLATADVRDPAALAGAVKRFDVVYHLAGLAAAFRPEELMAVNAGGFRNVARACANCQTPPVLISVSSLAAAGPSPADRPRVESDPPAPVSYYGRAKRAAELIAEEYADRVPITIVRPPIVFGEGDLQMLDVFRSIFRFGVHVALGVAQSRFSLIHVGDLVGALILCAQRGTRLGPRFAADGSAGLPRGYYFATGDEQPTFAELGLLIGRCLGRQRVRVLNASQRALLWSAAALAELTGRVRGKPYIFNFDKAREARAGNWTCSPQTIHDELGFRAGAPLIDRLAETADWYRQQNLL